jgi:hypothetical protein
VALSQAVRDLVPIREILKEILKVVFDCNPVFQYQMHSKAFDKNSLDPSLIQNQIIPQSSVFEEYSACLKFATLPQLTPRTKHIGIPYHWFHSKIEDLEIIIECIDVANQLADCFTKGLPIDLFKSACKRLLVW